MSTPASNFAAVTVLPAVSSVGPEAGHTSDATLTLHLPHAVTVTVTGVDADTITLLALELVRVTTSPVRS